jgi:uncharacterized membrane protein SpoIIM required for sporulation
LILDVDRFLRAEQPYWRELENTLKVFDRDPGHKASLQELARFHYLYQRAATSLARLSGNAGDPEVTAHLEALVARAYGEVHQGNTRRATFSLFKWLRIGFPQAFRRQIGAFWISLAITVAGTAFGWTALSLDPGAKSALMPFNGLLQSPHDRVLQEEKLQGGKIDPLEGKKTSFSADLMTHNIRVSVLTLAMGVTWGFGVVALLFYNGVSLGAVASDYVHDGQLMFLLGWLMPHGVIEIPAIMVAGQGGLVLAKALVGWRAKNSRRLRLAAARADIASLAGGMAVMLVWAGIMEAFVSQYHKPVLPYDVKIALGSVELLLLIAWLFGSGRGNA